MFKKMGIMLSLALFVYFMVYAQQYDDENDFRVYPLDGGRSVGIMEYVGRRQAVRVPSRIHGIPVTRIGEGSFAGKQLISITIPNSVTTIDSGAFAGNPLTNITIASGNSTFITRDFFLLSRDGNVIMYFGSEKDITIPNGVTTIQDGAFADNQLTGVTIPNGVTTIGVQAFADNQLTSVTIPNSVTVIGNFAFTRNRLTSITIPNSVRTIGPGAFADNQLTSITISNGVMTIFHSAFVRNRLTSVNIPRSVTTIQDGAFDRHVRIIRQ